MPRRFAILRNLLQQADAERKGLFRAEPDYWRTETEMHACRIALGNMRRSWPGPDPAKTNSCPDRNARSLLCRAEQRRFAALREARLLHWLRVADPATAIGLD